MSEDINIAVSQTAPKINMSVEDIQQMSVSVNTLPQMGIAMTMGIVHIKGDKGDPGIPGADGQNGAPGADGQDGYTPIKGEDYFDGADGTDGVDGIDAFVYIAYASSNTGTDFSLTPTDSLKYRAEIHVDTEIVSPQASDFTGAVWVKYIGDDGTGGEGSGDMLASTYDPNNKQADAFSMGNMVESATRKIMTADERTKLTGIETGANKTTVNNTLTSESTTEALSAAQGKELNDALATYKIDLASQDTGKGASLVSIEDADEKFTATNVEGALTEVKDEVGRHMANGTQHAKTARFVIGTSTAGWTAADCDYLCDGTEDDVEINNAITALPETGGEIVILDGTYNITAKIDVTKDNVSIVGNGNATILKRMWDVGTYDPIIEEWNGDYEGVIRLESVSGCKINNLKIDGNNADYTSWYNTGIDLYSSSNNTITGNTCNNNGIGIGLEFSSDNNTITGNTCNNNNSDGIFLDSSNRNTITGNTCNNNNNYGGIFLYSSSDNTITGNTCNNSSYIGIDLVSSSDNTITGNTCNNNNYNGIYLSSSGDNTITGNTCYNNTYGIYLYSSSSNTITGNTCIRGTGLPGDYTASQHTIQLEGTDNDYNLISNNNCMGKAVTNGGGTGNTIINNKWNATSDLQDLQSEVDAHMADYEAYVDKHKALKVPNPASPISLDQYIASLKMEYAFFSGSRSRLSNITEIPVDITDDFLVTVIGGRTSTTNTVLYYAAITVESMTSPAIKFFGQIYNITTFTGWKRIITQNEIMYGTGSPEGDVTAPVGRLYRRTGGGTSTTLYVKESGTGNTGWVAK